MKRSEPILIGPPGAGKTTRSQTLWDIGVLTDAAWVEAIQALFAGKLSIQCLPMLGHLTDGNTIMPDCFIA